MTMNLPPPPPGQNSPLDIILYRLDQLRGEMVQLRSDLNASLAEHETRLHGDISQVRSDIVKVRSDIADDIQDHETRLRDIETKRLPQIEKTQGELSSRLTTWQMLQTTYTTIAAGIAAFFGRQP